MGGFVMLVSMSGLSIHLSCALKVHYGERIS